MSNPISFIPLVELPTEKDAVSEKIPYGNAITNPKSWNRYQENEIRRNYSCAIQPISSGIYQYPLFDLNVQDLEKLIHLHISDTSIAESCSFFGGYGISMYDKLILYPQCCGLLEDINDWKQILDPDFQDFYLRNGHPSPIISKEENQLLIYCNDAEESFTPSTEKKLILNYQQAKSALEQLLVELELFSKNLDTLSANFGTHKISNILIWGTHTTSI